MGKPIPVVTAHAGRSSSLPYCSLSIFETESAIGEYRGEEEPTEPSLLSLTILCSLTPWPVCCVDYSGLFKLTFLQRSPRDIALPLSPEPSLSMSVSIVTPDPLQIPSIYSQPATIVFEPPCKILTRDVNKLLSYTHNNNSARDAQHEELTDRLRAIEGELLDWCRRIYCMGRRLGFVSVSRSAPPDARCVAWHFFHFRCSRLQPI
jgi:hypothetical protein